MVTAVADLYRFPSMYDKGMSGDQADQAEKFTPAAWLKLPEVSVMYSGYRRRLGGPFPCMRYLRRFQLLLYTKPV